MAQDGRAMIAGPAPGGFRPSPSALGRILLIGCGEIGSRHLQALAAVPGVRAIDVVDPRPEALALGQARLAEVAGRPPDLACRWLSRLDQATPDGGLCVVATTAPGRATLVRQAAEALGYRRFLLEKLVAQSVAEYAELQAWAARRHLAVWVNCKTRAYPFHQRAQARFVPGEPIQFQVIGGHHGLASNGLHSVDLFVFYDRSRTLTSAGSTLDLPLHPSKRGAAYREVSGTLRAISNHGSALTISFAAGHLAPPCYLVGGPRYRFWLDQWARLAFEAEAASGWAWRPVPFEGDLMISAMSQAFVGAILRGEPCLLPTLDECALAHTWLLRELLPHFQAQLGAAVTACPVT